MTMNTAYTADAPARAEVDAMPGATVIEFGTAWCGFCKAAQGAISDAMTRHPDVAHLKIEDGPGRALGRSFRVKLWPTLIFLRDGKELSRLVRPDTAQDIADALTQIEGPLGATHL